jgi:glycosyltransferase involved in cell wall biosynthesis
MPGQRVDDPLEVLLLAGRLGPDEEGWHLVPLMDRLANRGVSAHLVCSSRGRAAKPDPRFIEFPVLGRRWLRAFSIKRLRRVIGLPQPRILHAIQDGLTEVALELAETWGLPYLQTIDEFDTLERGLRLSRRWFHRLVVSCDDLAEDLKKVLQVPQDRISLICPGISLPRTPSRAVGRSIPVIGTAGPPVPGSGFACFLEAARLVLRSGRDAEFLIACHGKDVIDLRRDIESLKISDRVIVLDLPEIGRHSWDVLSVYCQPSSVPSVGRLLALAQAQAIPSIATNVRGLGTLINHARTGLLVPPDDPDALATGMIQLLDDPVQARAMGLEGQAAIRARFDPDLEADSLANLYRETLECPPRGCPDLVEK